MRIKIDTEHNLFIALYFENKNKLWKLLKKEYKKSIKRDYIIYKNSLQLVLFNCHNVSLFNFR